MDSIYYKKMIEGIELINKIPENYAHKYVAFFDIDDTLINTQTWDIIWPIYNLYLKTSQKGINVVVITARPGYPDNSKWTTQDLLDRGIYYSLLYMRPPNNLNNNYKEFSRRNAIEKTGGLIPLFSVGDQLWDCYDNNNSNKYTGVPLLLASRG
jgi:hypothetical protein